MQQQLFGFLRRDMIPNDILMRKTDVIAIDQCHVNARGIGSQNCLHEPFRHIVRFDAWHPPVTARPVQ